MTYSKIVFINSSGMADQNKKKTRKTSAHVAVISCVPIRRQKCQSLPLLFVFDHFHV
jgi:hypothetical protein